jgi:hypothetical protein
VKKHPDPVLVIAAPGRVVPLERQRRRFSEDEPRRVELTLYVRRCIERGDLIIVKKQKPTRPASGAGSKQE